MMDASRTAAIAPKTWAERFRAVSLTEGKRYNIPLAVPFDSDWEASNNNRRYIMI